MTPTVIGSREAQRLETRARVFDAALAEIGRAGLAGADVSAIAAAAGVVRGTFYFHFPTKEHVMVELERIEERKIVAELEVTTAEFDDLALILSRLVRDVLAAEERLGEVLFRDMLGLHFSSARPGEDELGDHPLAEFLVATIAKAQNAGRVSPDIAEPGELAAFFLTGLFALLATQSGPGTCSSDARAAMLDRYVTTIVQGMETR